LTDSLAADDQPDRREIGRRIGRLEVAVAPGVAQAVDDAGGADRDPRHLHRPDGGADGAEQQQVQDQQQPDALPGVAAVDMALEPVVGGVVAVLAQRGVDLGLGTVELAAAQQHGAQPARNRAVRVVGGLAARVVLAVDRDPLLGHHAGAQPQPEAEEVRRHGPEFERAVRLRTVQEHGDGDDGDVRGHQREQHDLPPRGVEQAVCEPWHDHIVEGSEFVHRLHRPAAALGWGGAL
jgi:hypothetical protein